MYLLVRLGLNVDELAVISPYLRVSDINIVILTPMGWLSIGELFIQEGITPMNIIDALYEGKLVPEAWCGKSSKTYQAAQAAVTDFMEGIDRKTADALFDQLTVMEGESTRDYFTLGFCWGMQLAVAALEGGGKSSP